MNRGQGLALALLESGAATASCRGLPLAFAIAKLFGKPIEKIFSPES